ncbi:hypothetical protein C8J57DRAFT_1518801 [Mycena rebaudengoi]|nr:hypothetical protein C8J57DRAFT_1518801 [Mycena rebaudengoi]
MDVPTSTLRHSRSRSKTGLGPFFFRFHYHIFNHLSLHIIPSLHRLPCRLHALLLPLPPSARGRPYPKTHPSPSLRLSVVGRACSSCMFMLLHPILQNPDTLLIHHHLFFFTPPAVCRAALPPYPHTNNRPPVHSIRNRMSIPRPPPACPNPWAPTSSSRLLQFPTPSVPPSTCAHYPSSVLHRITTSAADSPAIHVYFGHLPRTTCNPTQTILTHLPHAVPHARPQSSTSSPPHHLPPVLHSILLPFSFLIRFPRPVGCPPARLDSLTRRGPRYSRFFCLIAYLALAAPPIRISGCTVLLPPRFRNKTWPHTPTPRPRSAVFIHSFLAPPCPCSLHHFSDSRPPRLILFF